MILGQAKTTYGKGVDWWALGTLLYEMLVGLPPFYSADMAKMCRRILYDKLQENALVPAVAFDLISRLLTREPQNRLGSASGDMEQFKAHTFFHELHWGEVLAREVTPAFRPQAQESYIDPEAMQIPVGSEGCRGSLQNQEGSANSGSLPFNGFTYNKQSPLLSTMSGDCVSPLHSNGRGDLKDSSYSSCSGQSSTSR